MPNLYLLTSSLLNNFIYYRDYEGDYQTREYEKLLQFLSRAKIAPTFARQAGNEFEKQVYDEAINPQLEESVSPIIKEIANIVSNGFWQVKCKKELLVNDMSYLLYGKCDVVKENYIYDIKYTARYEYPKYYNYTQHLLYPYCTDIYNFEYLIGIKDKTEWFREPYYYSKEYCESRLIEIISKFQRFLDNDYVAKEFYLTNWKSL